MAMVIQESCINCGSCEPDCPNDAIAATETIYRIDAALCTECVGAASEPTCVQFCPVDETIIHDANHPESREALQEKYNRLHAAI